MSSRLATLARTAARSSWQTNTAYRFSSSYERNAAVDSLTGVPSPGCCCTKSVTAVPRSCPVPFDVLTNHSSLGGSAARETWIVGEPSLCACADDENAADPSRAAHQVRHRLAL